MSSNGTIGAIVGGACTLGVGALVLSKFQAAITITDPAANETVNGMFSTVWDAVGLMPIVFIVMVAASVLAYVKYMN